MAESTQSTDEFTCSICVDVFREPVTLPCQHSFCRSCLELFVKPEKAAALSVSSCPICRTPISLSRAEVAALPVNIKLAALVDKTKGHDPGCFMCEGETKSAAVTVCSTCKILYCEECFELMHPMRGPLKQHDVVSLSDFLSDQTDDSPAEVTPAPPTCDQHGDDLSLVCKSCSKLVCKKCLSQHENCNVGNIKQVCEEVKESIMDKTNQLRRFGAKLTEHIADLESVDKKIQNSLENYTDEIDKAYKKASKTLEEWRQKTLEIEETKHRKWRLQCRWAVKDIGKLVHDSVDIAAMCQQLLCKDDHIFLQERELIADSSDRTGDQISSMQQADTKYKQVISTLLTSLESHRAKTRDLRVSEKNQDDTLKFVKKSHKDILIRDKGVTVEIGNFASKNDYAVWTNGAFQSGEKEWTLQVNLGGLKYRFLCSVGVVHEGLRVGEEPGRKFWGILIVLDNWGYVGVSTLQDYSWVMPDFNGNCNQVMNRLLTLRLFLDCASQSLTVYTKSDHGDLSKEICTISDIDVSKALIPALVFNSAIPAAYVSASLL